MNYCYDKNSTQMEGYFLNFTLLLSHLSKKQQQKQPQRTLLRTDSCLPCWTMLIQDNCDFAILVLIFIT
jgi:hypothetical protein